MWVWEWCGIGTDCPVVMVETHIIIDSLEPFKMPYSFYKHTIIQNKYLCIYTLYRARWIFCTCKGGRKKSTFWGHFPYKGGGVPPTISFKM